MMKLLLLLALSGLALASNDAYQGFQILRTGPVTAESLPYLHKILLDPRYIAASSPRLGKTLSILTSNVNELRHALSAHGIETSVVVSDVSEMVAKERAVVEAVKRSETRSNRAASYDRYMTYDEILAFVQETAAANPSIASLENIATSYEGRSVQGIKISNGGIKNAVWIDCGIHAREWIAPPVCMRVIDEVIASSALRDLADWYVLPVGNPDGYAYTWTNGNRFWRKTRSPNANSICIGTDPNRNFDFMWNADGNTNPCSETYPGTAPFSESETDGIGQRIRALGQSNVAVLYLTVHSYGQVFYYPYGTQAEPAPNAPALQTCGDIGAAAIAAVRGTAYEVYSESNPFNFIYGAMDDYSYDVGTIPYSYTIELPAGGSGFDPPPSDILPVVTETWPGIEAMVRHVMSLQRK